jgi:hypothetical protein
MKRRTSTTTPPHRIFVLGAGVSAACGIAVAKDILRESILSLKVRNGKKTSEVHSLLRYLYPDFDEHIRNYPNVEDFLNLIEMAKSFNSEDFIESNRWSRERLDAVSQIILNAIKDYLWTRVGDHNKLRPLRDYAGTYLKHSDILITFNWDVTLERSLFDRSDSFEIPYTYSRHRQQKHFVILKPHGSIDWFPATEVSASLRKNMEALGKSKDAYVYPHFDFSRHPEVATCKPLMVPPVATKEFGSPFLRSTWRSVYHAIADAVDLRIFGYSLPKEDQFARLVFRRAIRNNIIRANQQKKRPLRVIIVNPDESVAMTFKHLFGGSVSMHFVPATFQDYLAGLEEMAEEEFEV